MGWSSGWNSRKQLVNHLTEDYNYETEGKPATLRVVKKCFRGNNLWAIMERVVDGQQVDKFIVLFMMQRWGKEGWAYKDVEETSGPTYDNCPVSWFDEVPDPGHYATDWREGVRKAAGILKSFKNGQRLTFGSPVNFTDGKTASEFTVVKIGRRIRFRRPDGQVCTLNKRLQQSAQIA